MALVVAVGCQEDGPPPAGKAPREDPCTGRGDGWWCDDEGAALRCQDEATEERQACEDEQVCQVNLGCASCTPNERACEDGELRFCRADGSGWESMETCEGGDSCTLSGCVDLCAQAAEDRSYVGCEYWPVTLANESLDGAFEPAIAVGNPQLQAARVVLSRGEVEMPFEVPPGEIEVVALPFDPELKEPFARTTDPDGAATTTADTLAPRSMLIHGGAYRLTSDLPVTVHQFNPLEYATNTCDDPRNQDREGCFSFTNDASLLLPTTAMTGNYVVITRPTLALYGPLEQQRPGIVAIVGTQQQPTEVTVRVSAYVAASTDDSDLALEALAPGDTLTVELGAGDVLQLASEAVGESCPGEVAVDEALEGVEYCDPGPEYDLTGTEIQASAPVEVLAGHDCTFVPFDRWACDHLEESMFPVESWGTHMVVSRPARENSEHYRVKVVSATDDNRISIQPPLDEPLVLDRGESFEWESRDHVVVEGSDPIAVAQFLIGQDDDNDQPGDPSMSLAIPTDQYKRAYDILTPETYDEVYVNLVTSGDAPLMLDGREIGGFSSVGDSGYAVVRQRIDGAGLHRVESSTLVGVVVYGFAPYTSYMVPGGLDLNLLHPPPF